MHLQCIGNVFGNHAIELAGRVVDPKHQACGIGTKLLCSFLKDYLAEVRVLTTYTRNPSVLKMLGKVCGGVEKIYPICNTEALRQDAASMDYATSIDGLYYHVNRYEPDGLFGEADPAGRPLAHGPGPSLKDEFSGLESVRNALIVVGKPERGSL